MRESTWEILSFAVPGLVALIVISIAIFAR